MQFQRVPAAYCLDPSTQGWVRYPQSRPEISDLLTLDNMQAVITLDGAAVPTPTATSALTPTPGHS